MHGTRSKAFSYSRASFLVPVIDVEIAETDTSFWFSRFWTLFCVVPQFVAVITCNLPWFLLLSSSFLVSDVGHIDFGGQSISRFPGIFLVPMLFHFFVFSSLTGRLEILGRSGHGSRGGTFRNPGVIPAIYFLLCLDLMGGDMGRLVPLETVQISLSLVRTRA